MKLAGLATVGLFLIVPPWRLSAANASLPDAPLGLMGFLEPSGRAFTLLWEPVNQTADGRRLESPAGYNVYRRTSLGGSAVKLNDYLLTISVFADRVNKRTFYYAVRAVDLAGRESDDSYLLDSSPQCNVIFLGSDGLTRVVIPGSSSDLLRPAHNKYGVSLAIKLRDETNSNGSGIVRSVRLQFIRGDTKTELTDLAFRTPDVDLCIGYNMVNGRLAGGAPRSASIEATAVVEGTPKELCLFWNNGVNWIKLGGVNDEGAQTINIKSSRLGAFELRLAPKAAALTLEKSNVYPGLITPNGDGLNDQVYFVLENPNHSEVTGKIFDLKGRFVATLPPPSQTAGVGTTLTWIGKDSNGSPVPSGLYVYRIEGDNKVLTGTVAVAK